MKRWVRVCGWVWRERAGWIGGWVSTEQSHRCWKWGRGNSGMVLERWRKGSCRQLVLARPAQSLLMDVHSLRNAARYNYMQSIPRMEWALPSHQPPHCFNIFLSSYFCVILCMLAYMHSPTKPFTSRFCCFNHFNKFLVLFFF